MKNKIVAILNARLWALFVLPNAVFLLIAYATDASWLINILNSVVLALAAGVCVAYAPGIYGILFTKEPAARHDWLVLGIFIAWMSMIEMRAWSIAWRWLGKPWQLVDSDFTSYGLFSLVIAAVMHLAAPGGVGNRVPTVRWIKIGVWIAVAVFIAIVAMRTFGTADLGIDRATAVARAK